MWLSTKIISDKNASKKTLQDYLPKLTPEQRAEGERQLEAAEIDKDELKINDALWEIFLADPEQAKKIKKAAGDTAADTIGS